MADLVSFGTASAQFSRFIVVGAGSNLLLYGGYLFITRLGVDPKIAMSVVFGFGVVLNFVLHKRVSFRHHGHSAASLGRFTLIYSGAYASNLAGLWLFVDHARLPHQAVQLGLMCGIATLLFVAQKFWVFRDLR